MSAGALCGCCQLPNHPKLHSVLPQCPLQHQVPTASALPLLSQVRCGNLCISSSSSCQSSLLPSVELLCQGHWGHWVPGEGGAVLGFGGSEVPVREGKDEGFHLCFTLQNGILHRLILPHWPSLVCLKGGNLKRDCSHSPF